MLTRDAVRGADKDETAENQGENHVYCILALEKCYLTLLRPYLRISLQIHVQAR